MLCRKELSLALKSIRDIPLLSRAYRVAVLFNSDMSAHRRLWSDSCYHEIGRLVRLDKAKIMISRLLAEGEQVALYIVLNHEPARVYPRDYPRDRPMDQDYLNLMSDWCRRTEDALRTYLNESYVTRFHLGGSLEQDQRSMTIWKARHRLETLCKLLDRVAVRLKALFKLPQ